jgi:hypothetical protein
MRLALSKLGGQTVISGVGGTWKTAYSVNSMPRTSLSRSLTSPGSAIPKVDVSLKTSASWIFSTGEFSSMDAASFRLKERSAP